MSHWRCTRSCGSYDTASLRFTAERFNPETLPSGRTPRDPGMVDAPALESILKEIEHNEGVHEAILVGLAGTYLAGTVPKGVHVDTFGSMFAVLVGSAETVTEQTKDVLDSVIIRSKTSLYLIVHGGRKALLVLRISPTADPQKTKLAVEKYVPRIEQHLYARSCASRGKPILRPLSTRTGPSPGRRDPSPATRSCRRRSTGPRPPRGGGRPPGPSPPSRPHRGNGCRFRRSVRPIAPRRGRALARCHGAGSARCRSRRRRSALSTGRPRRLRTRSGRDAPRRLPRPTR